MESVTETIRAFGQKVKSLWVFARAAEETRVSECGKPHVAQGEWYAKCLYVFLSQNISVSLLEVSSDRHPR